MRIIIIVCIVLLYIPSFGVDINSLLIESIGGSKGLETLEKLTSINITGTVNMSGMRGTFVQNLQMPNQYHVTFTFPGFSMEQGFDGTTAWQIGMNGQVSEIYGNERKEILKSVYLGTYQYLLLDSTRSTSRYIKDTTIDNRRYHVIAFIPFTGDTIFSYYNIETKVREYYTSQADIFKTENYETDYNVVNSILLPFKLTSIIKAANYSISADVKEYEFNNPIDPVKFRKPGVEQSDFHFPEKTRAVTIDFEYYHGHIRIPIVINGNKRVWMILDSGAASNIFNETSIESLELQAVGTLPAVGIGGYDEIDLLKTDSIQIGDLTLYNQVAGSMYLDEIGKSFKKEQKFGGILGYDFLSRFVILIDYSKQRLTVYNPSDIALPEGGKVIDFELTMLVPTIKASICGIEGNFLVDLGNAFSLIIHDNFSKTNQLEMKLSDIEDADNMIGGVGGQISSKKGIAADFIIGTEKIEAVEILLPESSAGMTGSKSISGNIGNRLLEQFRIVLDYRNNRMILYKNEG